MTRKRGKQYGVKRHRRTVKAVDSTVRLMNSQSVQGETILDQASKPFSKRIEEERRALLVSTIKQHRTARRCIYSLLVITLVGTVTYLYLNGLQ